MGSSSSRIGRRPSDESRPNRSRRILSSLVCGFSSSRSPPEMEEYPENFSLNSVENLAPLTDELNRYRMESLSAFDSENGFNGSGAEAGASSGSSTVSFQDGFPDKSILEGKDPSCPQVNGNSDCKETCFDKDCASAGTSYEVQSENMTIGLDEAAEVDNSASMMNNPNTIMNLNDSPSGTLSILSDSLLSLQLFGSDTSQVAMGPGTGFVVSDSDQDLLHVDVVSISSNILSSSIAEISNREARRNSRRLFWDALSRRSFRRHNDSPTLVFTTGHTDDLGSHDRWLLDLSGDLHYDGVGRELEFLGTRRHRRNERRWQLRTEISERFRSGLEEGGRRTTFCPSGLHPEGSCSCDSLFMGEDSSTFSSISRIVMLAEALFEVLDEIHHQPSSLSSSLPASESVVNSFPLKNHKRLYATENEPRDIEQCYICLAEYEEGDKIRVLPCHHEYHMACVDKWLKEIHGVCPLCRCNVGEGIAQDSSSTAEVPSQ